MRQQVLSILSFTIKALDRDSVPARRGSAVTPEAEHLVEFIIISMSPASQRDRRTWAGSIGPPPRRWPAADWFIASVPHKSRVVCCFGERGDGGGHFLLVQTRGISPPIKYKLRMTRVHLHYKMEPSGCGRGCNCGRDPDAEAPPPSSLLHRPRLGHASGGRRGDASSQSRGGGAKPPHAGGRQHFILL
ncbi:hypothetical protein EYF80_066243 [Liparis tanakae]|uniref:Uncharacterized protein n=1 Tax=Liparis tanakae TaxID=230148 RepID=A0A4Z2E4A3_9TELE|nr:hypothetical protein EYF80_066243 [Liparis tanakae]